MSLQEIVRGHFEGGRCCSQASGRSQGQIVSDALSVLSQWRLGRGHAGESRGGKTDAMFAT
jgi:hypothetical protein